MSHYMVAVIHKPEQSVDELLAPYSENIEVDPYLKMTKEEVIKYVRENYSNVDELSDEECWKKYVDGWGIGADLVDSDGNIYTTYNPKSKWDWWSYGGRFSGKLKRKTTGDYYDILPIKDIDFSPNKEAYEDSIKWWEDCFENKLSKEEQPFRLYRDEYYLNRYKNKETFAKSRATFSTFSVVTPDGEWHEPGQMGWFGISTETDEDYRDWVNNYQKNFIDPFIDGFMMSIVDCHI